MAHVFSRIVSETSENTTQQQEAAPQRPAFLRKPPTPYPKLQIHKVFQMTSITPANTSGLMPRPSPAATDASSGSSDKSFKSAAVSFSSDTSFGKDEFKASGDPVKRFYAPKLIAPRAIKASAVQEDFLDRLQASAEVDDLLKGLQAKFVETEAKQAPVMFAVPKTRSPPAFKPVLSSKGVPRPPSPYPFTDSDAEAEADVDSDEGSDTEESTPVGRLSPRSRLPQKSGTGTASDSSPVDFALAVFGMTPTADWVVDQAQSPVGSLASTSTKRAASFTSMSFWGPSTLGRVRKGLARPRTRVTSIFDHPGDAETVATAISAARTASTLGSRDPWAAWTVTKEELACSDASHESSWEVLDREERGKEVQQQEAAELEEEVLPPSAQLPSMWLGWVGMERGLACV